MVQSAAGDSEDIGEVPERRSAKRFSRRSSSFFASCDSYYSSPESWPEFGLVRDMRCPPVISDRLKRVVSVRFEDEKGEGSRLEPAISTDGLVHFDGLFGVLRVLGMQKGLDSRFQARQSRRTSLIEGFV